MTCTNHALTLHPAPRHIPLNLKLFLWVFYAVLFHLFFSISIFLSSYEISERHKRRRWSRLHITVYIFSDLLVYNNLMYLFYFKIFLLFSFIHELRCIALPSIEFLQFVCKWRKKCCVIVVSNGPGCLKILSHDL